MKPRQFFYVLLTLTALVIGGSAAGYVYAMKYITQQSTELSTDLAVQQSAAQQINTLTELGATYHKQIVPILPLIDGALPTNKDQTEILAQIEHLADNNGMSVGSISMPTPTGIPSNTSQTTATGAVLALPIEFSVTGTYSQLQTFTSQLENLNRFTNVTSLDVESQGTGIAQYTFNLDAYTKP